MNICVRSNFRQYIFNSFRCYSSSIKEAVEASEQLFMEDPEETTAREEQIKIKCNISRLTPAHYNLIHNKRPYDLPKCLAHKTVKYNRKLYGKYGIESGVNPSICWPSKKEIEERKEYESVAFPYTIPEMIEQAAERRKQQQIAIQERDKDIAVKFAKLGQWKKELQDRLDKKVADAQAAKNKKERLVEEVRRHFGFKLDPRDERFQEMLAKREKEQKKEEKLARRDLKEKAMIAKLQQKNVEMKEKEKGE